jgi:hypothetical protein
LTDAFECYIPQRLVGFEHYSLSFSPAALKLSISTICNFTLIWCKINKSRIFKMSWRLHDTIFGQVVRFLTSNKYYRYPDEIDPTLWEKAVQKAPPAADNSTVSGEESKDKEAQDGAVETQSHKVASVKTEKDDILLVGWYGADDPEVVVPDPSISFILLTVYSNCRTHKIGLNI